MGKNNKKDKTPFWKRQIAVTIENLIVIIIGMASIGAYATMEFPEAGAFFIALGLITILIKCIPYLEALSTALSEKSENKQKTKSQQ